MRPPFLGLENVPEFADSGCHRRLRAVLDKAGYGVREILLCPTELGIPMRRRRFYLMASREGLAEPPKPHVGPRAPLTSFLEAEADTDPALIVEENLRKRYEGALDIVDPEAEGAVTACFTAAYGRSPVRSGSYLYRHSPHRKDTVRRFSPGEILRLLGFPPSFRIPEGMPHREAWRLVGNSLSVDAVRYCMRYLMNRI